MDDVVVDLLERLLVHRADHLAFPVVVNDLEAKQACSAARVRARALGPSGWGTR